MNNRQGGRRRGRSGQPPRGMSGSAGGNSRDNRQRGNAAQLLEKYKSLARDAQLAGDRVQTEYYLQFADHYFRVLGENRPRVDDQRSRRDEDDDGDELDEDNLEADGEGEEEPRGDRYRERGDRDRQDRERPDRDRGNRQPRAERYERDERPERADRAERAERPERVERADDDGGERRERVARDDRPERTERRPRRERLNGRDRDGGQDQGAGGEDQRIPQHILPPAIGVSVEQPEAGAEQEERPAPRRRTRRVRPVEDEGEIAPAA